MIKFAKAYLTEKIAIDIDILSKHDKKLEVKIWDKIDQYLIDAAPLQREKYTRSKKGLWHSRVDGEKRIVDEPYKKDGRTDIVLHAVGHHEVNEWAETFNGDTDRLIETAQVLVPTDEKQKSISSQKADTPTIKLRKYSIPVPKTNKVRSVELDNVSIKSYKYSPLIDHFKCLSDEQRDLVIRDLGALHAIKGAAGSGKTVIAFRKIETLCKDDQQSLGLTQNKILYLCHNRVLADIAKQILKDLLGPDHQKLIDVFFVHQFIGRSINKAESEGVAYTKKEELLPILKMVIDKADKKSMPKMVLEEIYDEVSEIILGRALFTLEDYQEADRSGMGKKMDPGKQREWVWEIFVQFMKACKRKILKTKYGIKKGLYPWERMSTHALKLFENKKRPITEKDFGIYTHVFIDEAQDLTPATYKLFQKIWPVGKVKLLLLGDATQSIYRRGFQWKLIGYDLRGRTTILKNCFRSTTPIIRAVTPLVAGQGKRFGEDMVVPECLEERDRLYGAPKVDISIYLDQQKEIMGFTEKIYSLVSDGVNRSTIAIILNQPHHQKEIQRHLQGFGIMTESYLKEKGGKTINLNEDSVKLISSWSAKGLEFEQVFIPFVDSKTYPGVDDDGETADKARRSLYTAMLRCSWNLHLSANVNYSPLLNELEAQYVDRKAVY